MILALALCFVLATFVQASPPYKRNSLGIRVGMWNQVTGSRTEVGIGSVTNSVDASGVLGGISYDHRFQDNMAFTFSTGGMLADLETKTTIGKTTTETAVVAPILFGLKYYFLERIGGTTAKPFVNGAAGPFIGHQQKTEEEIGTVLVESRSQTVIGGQLGGGIDIFMGRYFMMDVAAGYNFMSDFDEPIGGSRNYSGPEFNFGLSFIF